MTQQAMSLLETVVFYGLESPEKMYARYRTASQKCILLFISPPPDDFDDESFEQGRASPTSDCSVSLRLDLVSIREVDRLDKQNSIDSSMTDYSLGLLVTDGSRHHLCFTSLSMRDEWFSQIQSAVGKNKSQCSQSLLITGVSPHQPLVIGNSNAEVSIDSVSSSDSSVEEPAVGKKEQTQNKALVLKGNPQDYPALANWSTSLIRYGYGYKKGAKRKNWKYRFFVLTQHSFAYFESEKKKNPISSIPISNVRSIYQRKDMPGHSYVMAIDTDDRMHLWKFDTEEELRGWMEDFADHVKIKSIQASRSAPKLTPQTLSFPGPPTADSSNHTSANIANSLPANLHAAVDTSLSSSSSSCSSKVVIETKVFDGAVVRKKVVRKTGHRGQDSDSDESADEDSSSAVVSKSAKALVGIDSSFLVRYGYCLKEGGVVHNWKRRFFVLTRGTLSYFKSPNDAQAVKIIKVNTITSVLGAPAYQGRNFVIAVHTHSRNYFIQCETQSLSLDWIDDLTKCREYQERFKPAASTPAPSDQEDILHFSPVHKQEHELPVNK